LSPPDTKVIVFGGDGSLVMNLETLVTIGERGPTNWYRVVLENGMYATTGGQPIPG
jgi:thiamine pyrophosphate-dependent acetolactate synthase large subunit-like protein